MCAVAGYFLIYAISLRLPRSMNKIKKKKKALATTRSNALTRLSAAVALNHTLLGTAPAPQLPVQPVAAFAHILHPCVLTATGPMRHTLPPVQNAQFIRTVLTMRMMIRIACRWSALEEVTRDDSLFAFLLLYKISEKTFFFLFYFIHTAWKPKA